VRVFSSEDSGADAPFAKLPSGNGPIATRTNRNTATPSDASNANVTVPALVQDNFEPGIALAAAKHTDIPDCQGNLHHLS